MTVKKIMGIIALVIFGGIGLFIFFLYATIKTKSTSLDKYKPFSEWLGKTVTLKRETVLFKEKMRMNTNGKYPYTLIDSLHEGWEYILALEENGDVTKITTFPIGTELSLEKAIQYTNGVSGSSYPTIFGTIKSNGKEYKVGYQWGKLDLSKNYYQIEKSWKFDQAPWQTKQDTADYALPKADFW
ncbi:hypothetical protein [Sphingobacterium wenxiniae]|uniref:Uncharacterized protein n=1 Tax=Sphingobacterium wenxiniae TaxID=683125 RepID=A0A1I6S3F9_9SPHI|nr:hypothetical protein [Sphingobacterium wenxiniae]SFS71469.1 hypothetical protein SAMN05660206_10491 [Sphingobacterium wenxiniae]